jgi:hypothetical protein
MNSKYERTRGVASS